MASSGALMLNKGAFINEAISMPADIFGRMPDHTQKKSMLRCLRAWDGSASGTRVPGIEGGTDPPWS